MVKARPLTAGSMVRIIAPSSPFQKLVFEQGVSVLRQMGFEPFWSDRIFSAENYLAGPDSLRLQEFQTAFGHGEDGVLAARGGYGAPRLLGPLMTGEPPAENSLFMGFSDITALHLYLVQYAGFVTFHGPNVTTLSMIDQDSLARVKNTLFGTDWDATFSYSGLVTVRQGVGEGRLVGGNLTLLACLAGTPVFPDLAGRILVVEDVGEAVYRLDRMLNQLSLQTGFDKLAGLVIGELGVPEADSQILASMISGMFANAPFPVVTGLPVGHKTQNYPIPLGVMARLSADTGFLEVIEDPYERSLKS